MGTCCGKVEKKTTGKDGSFPEALDEAKPLRPLRDAEVRRRKANKSLESLETATEDDKTEESPIAASRKNIAAVEKGSEIQGSAIKSDEKKDSSEIVPSEKIEEKSKIQSAATGSDKTEETADSEKIEAAEKGSEIQVAATESDKTEESLETVDKTEAVEQESEVEKEETKLAVEDTSDKIEQVRKSIQNFDLKDIEEELRSGARVISDASSTPNLFEESKSSDDSVSTNQRTKSPDLVKWDNVVNLEEACTKSTSEPRLEESKLENAELFVHEPHASSSEALGSEKALENVALEQTVFPLGLSCVEKNKLEAEGIHVDDSTEADKPKLTEALSDRAESDKETKIIAKDAARSAGHSPKLESDLEALLTPDLLKKLNEQTVSTNGPGGVQNEVQKSGGGKESDETTKPSKETLTRSTTAPDISSIQQSHPASARLSQQEQRKSRNSFLGNFLQEGVFTSFDEQFNSMTSKELPKKIEASIEAIARSTESLRRQVETFSGGKTGTEYMYLESSLLINIDELNKIETESTEKADALSQIYELLKKLDENSVF